MSKAWLFQANPQSFDIETFLEERPSEFSFLASQHASEMRIGDRVYIWRSKGGDPDWKSGIIAGCEIVEEARERSEDLGSKSYWLKTDDRGERVLSRVRLKLLSLIDRRLSRSEAKANPILKGMAVFTSPRQTNYPLSQAEADEIQRLRPFKGAAS